MRIINDIHFGVRRQAGTTPAAQQALADYVSDFFTSLLPADNDNLVINGDLFDGFTVDPLTLLIVYETLVKWLEGGTSRLALVAGNHDWNPRGDKLSSFHLLGSLLTSRYPKRVRTIDARDGLTALTDNVWAIPHMPNQDLFDLELERAAGLAEGKKFLLLHANYDNNFAVEADHSLNVSPDQAELLINKGWHLVFAHEHQFRSPRPGVTVVGNQFPTSVADCLGNETKRFIEIHGGELKHVACWVRDQVYTDTDWRHLDMEFEGMQFIRVSGNAKAEETDQVLAAIAALRKRHSAFVISNAVKIEGMAGMDELANLNLDQVQTYDVLQALLEELSEAEGTVVKELLQ